MSEGKEDISRTVLLPEMRKMIFFIRKIIQISKLVSCEWTSGFTSMTRQTKILLTEIKIISLSWFLPITVSEQCDQVVHNSAQTQRNDSAEMPLKLEGDNERWNEWIDIVDDGYKECQLLWKPQDNPGYCGLALCNSTPSPSQCAYHSLFIQ